jgi:hypothetical protein
MGGQQYYCGVLNQQCQYGQVGIVVILEFRRCLVQTSVGTPVWTDVFLTASKEMYFDWDMTASLRIFSTASVTSHSTIQWRIG